MNTKLTLRMDEALVHTANAEAGRRGKSVSQMVGEFFDSLKGKQSPRKALPPITTSLVGVIRRSKVTAATYKTHLREKYL